MGKNCKWKIADMGATNLRGIIQLCSRVIHRLDNFQKYVIEFQMSEILKSQGPDV